MKTQKEINPEVVEGLRDALLYLSEFIIASKAFDTEEKAYLMYHSNAEALLESRINTAAAAPSPDRGALLAKTNY